MLNIYGIPLNIFWWMLYMHLFIPSNKIHSHHYPMWFNSETRYGIKCFRMLHHLYKHHPTQCSYFWYDWTSREGSPRKVTATKLTFESELINTYTSSNNNTIIKYPKFTTKSINIPSVMNLESLTANTDHSIANLFNQYFHSVFHDLSNIDDLLSMYTWLS